MAKQREGGKNKKNYRNCEAGIALFPSEAEQRSSPSSEGHVLQKSVTMFFVENQKGNL